jgi:transposase-like protein
VRESAQSWRGLLIDVRRRRLDLAPVLPVDDSALGFWNAIDEVFPGTSGNSIGRIRQTDGQEVTLHVQFP